METVTEGKTTGEWYAWIVISILIILLLSVFPEINLKMNIIVTNLAALSAHVHRVHPVHYSE